MSDAPDWQQIDAQVTAAGTTWAQLRHAARVLEKTEAAVFARLVVTIRESGEKVSLREAELRARASDEWENHVYALTEARYQADLAQVKYDALKARFESMRSQEATRRMEMQTSGRT